MRKPKKALTKIPRGTNGYGGSRGFCLRVGRYRGPGGNNRRIFCHTLEMFGYLLHRRSFPSLLVPTLLGQLPRPFTKTNVPCVFRLSGPFTLQDERYNFLVPPHPERVASSEHFINDYTKGIDICLLGNSARAQVKFAGME